MRIQSLALRGFKSFADPVQLPLEQGLIGIVGPNGCGKSNIADALRWITGQPKSRLLRIEKSEELIFNGSARRKPLPYAEVSLEVANFSPEWPRLTFTRRVHRSGETEYLLNGTAARLKDFLTYFWQLGLSPQSILDGAQIEALIHDRGGARRALLESLAGIEKYHHQRRELLVEIEKTRQALTNLDSLLAELRKQILELKKQAGRVEKYYELKAQYRSLLERYIAGELAHYQKQLSSLSKEKEALEKELQAVAQEIDLRQSQLTSEAPQALREKLRISEAAYKTLSQSREQLTQEQARITERLSQLSAQLERLSEEALHRTRQRNELLDQQRQNSDNLKALQSQSLEIQMALEAALQELGRDQQALRQSQATLNSLREQEASLLQKLHLLRLEKQKRQTWQAALAKEQETLQKELVALQKTHSCLLEERAELERCLAESAKQLTEAQANYDRWLAEHQRLQQALEKARQAISQLEVQRRSLTSERQVLESLRKQAPDWPQWLRQLLARWSDQVFRLEEVFYAQEPDLPLLALLLRLEPPTLCIQKRDVLAELQKHLVCEKEGFFRILSPDFEPGPEAPTAAFPIESAQWWPNCLRALPGFERLAAALWGDVWVLEKLPPTLPKGIKAFEQATQQLHTPIGTVYHLGTLKTAHIGLPHRIAHLQKEETDLSTKRAKLEEELKATQAAIAALPIEAAAKTLQKAKEDKASLEKQLEIITHRLLDTQKGIEHRQKRLAQLEAEAARHQADLAQLEREEVAYQEATNRISQQAAQQASQQKSLEERLRTAQTGMQDLRYQAARLEERLKQEERHQKLIAQQLEEVRKRLAFITVEEERLQKQKAQTQARLEALAAELEHLTQQITDLEARQQQHRAALADLEKIHAQHQAALSSLMTQHQALHEKQSRLALRQAEYQAQIALLEQRLSVELEKPPQTLPLLEATRLKKEEVEAQLESLRQQMSRLGELNFEAKQSLDQHRERERTLDAEKRDIELTLSQLEQFLHHLDREAQTQFAQTFEAVRSAFVALFRQLFMGDDVCDLVLLDPANPLTSEIEILARPKGKRPLSIQQLSGGEKALTVLALLLATFSIRPSALCVLDEVDAPLDDHNAAKFGALLRHFSQNRQILVITHNKTTMSYCEMLYGVTMPEPGVSAILGVELEKAVAQVSAA